MDKFLPGVHLLPRRVRRVLGWTLLAVIAAAVAVSIIAVASVGKQCGGGYPDALCKAPLDSVVDQWGMYNRECVSYTAFRVAESGRTMPYGFGDANKWPDAARAHGIAVDMTPRVGDVAILPDGEHGHSMYVESINADGTLTVSQYNKSKLGTYTEERVSTDGLIFIHF